MTRFPPLRPAVVWRALALGTIALATVELRAATAVIDVDTTHQIIRGFGGATVFQPPTPDPIQPLSSADLDTLFGTGPGQLGFSLLRIRVAEDDAWRAIELSNAQGARARGAKVIATPWSPPVSMKSNRDLVGGSLEPSSYAAYAKYLNDFALYMAASGAELYAISVQNEPDITVDYDSCVWTPEQMLDFCRNHAGAITATRVIAPESFQFRRNMSDPILEDPVALANVDIIGGHIYGGGLADYPLARARGREVWMTEHLDLSTDWTGALATGREIHDCLAAANFSAYFWWYLKRYYGPLGEDGMVTKRGAVMAQFSRFIRPGYLRVEATANPENGVYVSAYARDKLVIVAINQGTAAVSQSFSVENATVNSVTPWVTSSSVNLEEQPPIDLVDGAFSATLPAESITTFVGTIAVPAPAITLPPRSHTVARGSTFVLDVTAAGQFVTYQWIHDARPIAGATDRFLTVVNAQASDAGSYAVEVTNSGGSVISAVAAITIVDTAKPGQLANISTRSPAGTGNEVQIGGFVISGTVPRPVLVRAAGPALALAASFPLSDVLADPVVELHVAGDDTIVAGNDDWDPALAATFASLGAFAWDSGSKDAALLVTLEPGAYTAVVHGADGGTGIALIEVYDAAPTTSGSRLLNISTRSLVGTGDEVQIGGFVVDGTTASTVVVRASGPALANSFGLTDVLADPVIELHDHATGTVIGTSDDWEESLASHFATVGAFGWLPESSDAALVTTLDPGVYSVVVRDRNNGSGVALVEIYEER